MTNGDFERQPRPDQESEQQLIAEVLPRYYEAYGDDLRYEIERSIMIDGHEVAWAKYEGTVAYDTTGEDKEEQRYSGHELVCACKFTEGVGWRMDDNGRPVGITSGDKCLPKEAAMYLRQLELSEEYKAREMFGRIGTPGKKEVEAIMFDLIEKAKAEEFLEVTSGARFWGGYYYLQTVAAITKLPMKSIWEVADKLAADKKIQIEGAVVQPYFEPAPPTWEPYTSYELDGWVATASLPTHSKMPQEWRFEVTKPDGGKLEVEIPGEALTHDPIFGPDVDDVNRAQERLVQIIEQVKQS